jgi:hypothetical protein
MVHGQWFMVNVSRYKVRDARRNGAGLNGSWYMVRDARRNGAGLNGAWCTVRDALRLLPFTFYLLPFTFFHVSFVFFSQKSLIARKLFLSLTAHLASICRMVLL